MAFRAFIAVEVADLDGAGPLLAEVAQLPADLKVVPIENLHVTLAFLGSLDEALVPPVRDAIAAACADERVHAVRLAGLGTFPARGSPRVLWVALYGADPLSRIAARLRPRLAELGLPVEDRPFSPHLTLARTRSPRGADAVRRFAQAQADREIGTVRVREVGLYESQLSPRGPTYRAVAAVPLEAAA